jgi:hypothetical protein
LIQLIGCLLTATQNQKIREMLAQSNKRAKTSPSLASSASSASSSSLFPVHFSVDLLSLVFSFLPYYEVARSSFWVNHFFHDAVSLSWSKYVNKLYLHPWDFDPVRGFIKVLQQNIISSCSALCLCTSFYYNWSAEQLPRLVACFPSVSQISSVSCSLYPLYLDDWTVLLETLRFLSHLQELDISSIFRIVHLFLQYPLLYMILTA